MNTRNQSILARHRAGDPIKAIAMNHGISPSLVREVINGGPKRSIHSTLKSKQWHRRKAARIMADLGADHSQIAFVLQTHADSVRKLLNQ